MTDPFLSLWLCGADAWIAAARGVPPAETQCPLVRMAYETAAQAARFWSGAWMLPAPSTRPTTADRMAALSLRVVEGGRR